MPHFDLVGFIKAVGYVGVFGMIVAESGPLEGIFFPGDSLLLTAGFLVAQGNFSIWMLMPLVFLAAVLADAVGYVIGHRNGPWLVRSAESRFFKPVHVRRAEACFERRGRLAVVLARFLPITRTVTPVVAGAGRMHNPRLPAFNVTGGFLWAVGVTSSGYVLGSAIPNFDHYALPIVLLALVFSLALPVIHLWRENRQDISLALRTRLERSAALQ